MYLKIPDALPLKVRPGDSWSGRFPDKFLRSGVRPSFDRRTAGNSSNSQALFYGGRVEVLRSLPLDRSRVARCLLLSPLFSAREMCCQVRIISESGDSGGIPELDLRARRREIYVNPRTIQGRDAEGFPGFEVSADSGRFACLARLDIDLSVNAGQSCVRGSRESPPFSHLNRVQAGTFQDPSLQQPVFRERPRGDSG